MTSTTATPNWARIARHGAIAGIVGAVVFTAFLFTALSPLLHGSLAALFARDAADIHMTSPWVGALARLCVSFAWAIAYAYAASTRPRVLNTPWLSGFVFGLVVWFIMQLVLMAGEAWNVASLDTFPLVVALAGHAFFFGIPVALTVRALDK